LTRDEKAKNLEQTNKLQLVLRIKNIIRKIQGYYKQIKTTEFFKMNTAGGSANTGGDDYVDKGVSAIEQKLGKPQNRALNEKITDALRSAYEKLTGKKVSSKISN